jgi:hypothetical protein
LGPPAREQDPKQPISKAKARATNSAALENSDLMAQRDRFQQLRGEGSGALAGDFEIDALVAISMRAQTIAGRLKPPTNSRGSSNKEPPGSGS